MSNIKASIEGGYLKIDMDYIMENLSDDERALLMKHLAMKETVFRGIVETVATGGEHGWMWDDWCFDISFITRLRETLIPLMPEVAQHILSQNIRMKEQEALNARRWSDWAWSLYQRWPVECVQDRPDTPPFVSADWSNAREKARSLLATHDPITESRLDEAREVVAEMEARDEQG